MTGALRVRHEFARLALLGTCVAGVAGAQRPGAEVPGAARPTIEVALSGAVALPGAASGSRGLGPVGSVQVRWPTERARVTLLTGVAYGVMFTNGYRLPDGSVSISYRPEAVIGALGLQRTFGVRRALALDLQWNPNLGRVVSRGEPLNWSPPDDSWSADYSAFSLGARYALASTRGPEVALVARVFAQLHPMLLTAGSLPLMPTVGVALRPR